MRRLWSGAAMLGLALALAPMGCNGILGISVLSADGGPTPSGPPLYALRTTEVDKVDLLFMIDNSASMGDKQTLLSLAVPVLIQRLVAPNCVDATSGQPTGMMADPNCPAGSKPEFPPVHDLHIGIVTSSLGGRGGDQCPDNATNPAAPNLSAHTNDKGELVNRGGVQGSPTVENPMADETSPDNFLAYFPGCSSGPGSPCTTGPNAGKNVPNDAVTSATTLVGDFTTAVLGVHEHGCGFEAQNEAWYRFLVQPDPFASINTSGATRAVSGIDETILKQRADFLRPDSLLAVIVVTDENEEAADPLAISGQGWAFDNTAFPGSPNMAAPQGTIECSRLDPNNPSTTGPNDPNCTSCAFIRSQNNFSTECPNDPPGGTDGFLDPSDDALNVRFFHQKERFGLVAGYPTSRYVMGLQKTSVPSVGLAFPGDKDHEHDGNGNYIGDQPGQQNCVNPIYAQDLPTSGSQDLCTLTRGPRTPDLVYYGAIAGVPHQLLQQEPTNATSPQKDVLTAADWKLILGNDPEHYDFSGADFHMIESEQDRTSGTSDPSSPAWANHSSCPDTSADNCDPVNGREWATNKSDLQFACIFPLVSVVSGTITAFQKDCTSPGPGDTYKGACDCAAGALNAGSQLCQKGGSGYTEVQINGKAYPSVREMIIAHAMSESSVGNKGVVSSICPINLDVGQTVAQAQQDPLFGYNPAVNAIVSRIKGSLGPNNCLPISLPSNAASCTIIIGLPNKQGPGSCKNPGSACSAAGLVGPGSSALSQDTLNSYCDEQEQYFLSAGGTGGAPGDPDLSPACGIPQLTPAANPSDFDSSGSCAASASTGWCYLTGAAAGGCAQTIVFSKGQPPAGSTATLTCPGLGSGTDAGQ